ncbi:MAG TPA: hypothetical protein VMB21_07030 [Candidatus Limnocylindria bacterium]|nr:hypothetical protein [Candidatus Limnocylindria bacterium]
MPAAMHGNKAEARAVPSPLLKALCRKFWWPPYALLRDQESAPADASILTRHFLEEFSRGNEFGGSKLAFLRLRTGMFGALNSFLASGGARASAYQSTLDLSEPGPVPADAESRMGIISAGVSAPGDAFRRRWALVTLDSALAELRRECVEAGRLAEFEALKPGLARRQATTDDVNSDDPLTAFRARFQKLTLEEVSQTVSTPAELDAEFRELFD